MTGPSITWTRRANNQPEFLEAIDGRGHGATRQAHLVLDLGYGKRALVQQGFERGESVRHSPCWRYSAPRGGSAHDNSWAITSQAEVL